MPRAKTTCAKATPYKRKTMVTTDDNLYDVRAKGDRMIRRASMMWRIDPVFNGVQDTDGPEANTFIVKYSFPPLEKPNAGDLSSLCVPANILLPRIQDIKIQAYGTSAVETRVTPGALGWDTNADVKSVIMATTYDPKLWYESWKADVVAKYLDGVYTFDESSAALELLLVHARPFLCRVDNPSSFQNTPRQATQPGNSTSMVAGPDDGKVFQIKVPQLMQASVVWFICQCPGMFDEERRCCASIFAEIDYDYEKVDMKQYLWMQTQNPNSILNVYNDTPYAKAYGPMAVSEDGTGQQAASACYAYTSEGDFNTVLVRTAGATPPNVEATPIAESIPDPPPKLVHCEMNLMPTIPRKQQPPTTKKI